MSGLFESLGLGNVSADPNDIPDNSYNAIVSKSEYLYSEKKGTLSHVISYKVTGPTHAGALKQEWFLLVENPVKDENGQWTVGPGSTVPGDSRRSFHVRRLNDLGIPSSRINQFDHMDILNLEVVIQVKTNNGYQNIAKLDRVDASSGASGAPQGVVTSDPASLMDGI